MTSSQLDRLEVLALKIEALLMCVLFGHQVARAEEEGWERCKRCEHEWRTDDAR